MVISNPVDINFELDKLASAQGSLLFRGSSDWEGLAPQAFSVPVSKGASADPYMLSAGAL